MRGPVVCLIASLLAACGSPRAELPISANAPRFADTDPIAWTNLAPAQYPVHGIDVSRYQGSIDWGAVRASGTAFAFIKATEGGDVFDTHFAANWTGARDAGVARGAYHFYYFCRSAREQALWFTRHVPPDPSALPPVLDMEWNHRSRNCPFRPEPQVAQAEMRVFLEIVAGHYGKRPVIYTTVDFYRDNALWQLQGFDFWLRAVADHPANVYPGQPWAFWQYTSTGIVSGILGPIDINVFAGTPAQWLHWSGG